MSVECFSMIYRSRKHTNLAHDMPCLVTHPHACNDANGCEPMHANWQEWGKGVGLKAPDWAWASGCPTAHKLLDDKLGQSLDLEQRKAVWLHAYIATQNWLWENGKLRVSGKGNL